MELAHFLSMVQFEVLKSFEYASQLQEGLNAETGSEIQLGMQGATIEIPVILDTQVKQVDLESIELQTPSNKRVSITHLDMPFSKQLPQLHERMKVSNGPIKDVNKEEKKKKKKKKINGEVITIKVAGPNTMREEGFDPALVGKISLEIKPIMA